MSPRLRQATQQREQPASFKAKQIAFAFKAPRNGCPNFSPIQYSEAAFVKAPAASCLKPFPTSARWQQPEQGVLMAIIWSVTSSNKTQIYTGPQGCSKTHCSLQLGALSQCPVVGCYICSSPLLLHPKVLKISAFIFSHTLLLNSAASKTRLLSAQWITHCLSLAAADLRPLPPHGFISERE